MSGEEIVQILNNDIIYQRNKLGLNNKCHLILHRVIQENRPFKVYKTCNTILWFIDGNNKIQLFNNSISDKILDNNKDVLINSSNKALVSFLFKFIRTDKYIELINGTYTSK